MVGSKDNVKPLGIVCLATPLLFNNLPLGTKKIGAWVRWSVLELIKSLPNHLNGGRERGVVDESGYFDS